MERGREKTKQKNLTLNIKQIMLPNTLHPLILVAVMKPH